MTTFFTADTHFGHGGALGLYRRPFASVAAMDEAMLRRWNDTVKGDDEVWHLGDFAVGRTAAGIASLLDRLHGRKHLVVGNNDSAATLALTNWTSVQTYREFEHEGRQLVLCHYAFRTWHGMNRGAINLHGHSHGRLSPIPRQFDVGVDANDFRPVPLSEIPLSRRRH